MQAPGFLGLCGLEWCGPGQPPADSKARWEQVRGSRGSVGRGDEEESPKAWVGSLPGAPRPGLLKDSFSGTDNSSC